MTVYFQSWRYIYSMMVLSQLSWSLTAVRCLSVPDGGTPVARLRPLVQRRRAHRVHLRCLPVRPLADPAPPEEDGRQLRTEAARHPPPRQLLQLGPHVRCEMIHTRAVPLRHVGLTV